MRTNNKHSIDVSSKCSEQTVIIRDESVLPSPLIKEVRLLNKQNSQETVRFETGPDDDVTASQEKMKIDLSVVSFLKPHIVNPETYSLAHQGFTRE